MADITKKVDRGIPPTSRSQNFTKGEATTGDVILVESSLGHPARHVRVETTGGATAVRFNVYNTVFKKHTENNAGLYGMTGEVNPGSGFQYKSDTNARFDVEAGTTLALDNFPIKDIEVIASSGNFDIQVW